MTVFVDANILLRSIDPVSPQHATANSALTSLKTQGHALAISPQAIYECWVVLTRPVVNNGFGLSAAEADTTIEKILSIVTLADDLPGLFAVWRSLVRTHACHGKVAHDARYVAAMTTHLVTHLLTFNVSDFARYPGITIVDPATAAAA